MNTKLALLAATGLLSLSACGVYQDYPNDKTAVEHHRGNDGYHGRSHYSGTHPYATRYVTTETVHVTGHDHMHDGHPHHAHVGHSHAEHHKVVVDTHDGDAVVGQDKDSYMRQNEDKWMYNSCPPGAAKRGDC